MSKFMMYMDLDIDMTPQLTIVGNRYQPLFKDFDYYKARAYVAKEFGL